VVNETQRSFPLLVVVGPTASGKTAVALVLAEHFGGEIVSFDSMQLYKGFELGTAQPTREELARIRHHFIGEIEPTTEMTAGEYARQGRFRIRQIVERGRAPVLVGGTGFYLRALLEGLFAGPSRQEELRARLRQRVRARGPQYVHRILRRVDRAAAARIAPRDVPKAIRAIEVRLVAGRPMGELWRALPPEPFAGAQPIKIGLNPPRELLYDRINRRAEHMFGGPIQEETRHLLSEYPVTLKVFNAHGYKQACDLLLRGASLPVALPEAQQEQRNYAKRQLTWFRRDRSIHWLAGFGDDPAIQRSAIAIAEEELGLR
jgi:tRNA dimethylallyltransferase